MTELKATLMLVALPTVLTICGVAMIVGFVWLAGGTFGQRCARAFPDDGLAQERCVDNLAHGRPI